MSESLVAGRGSALHGSIRVPGDKSISHRSIMLGALAEGTTQVRGFLEGEDALATRNIFRALGVRIDGPEQGRVAVHGVGLRGLRAPQDVLDCGNSGTSMRLLAGILGAQPFDTTLVGDASLSRRPMRRVIEPLARMGVQIDSRDGLPPLQVRASREGLRGHDLSLSVASAQVKSALLLAGLQARGTTRVTEPAPTRDHTERMLGGFGVAIRREGSTLCIEGGQSLKACAVEVPADISSAAFFLVAASICPGSDLLLQGVGVNPTRTGVLKVLRAMGADIEMLDERESGGEPVADLRVRHAPLHGIEVPPEWVPLGIDEFPVLFIAAACARGVTTVRGAEELRVKESDRIAAMAAGLDSLGLAVEPLPDGMRIQGRGDDENVFGPGTVDSLGDHRIAMSFAVAAQRSSGPLHIRDSANVNTSFPGFAALARQVGMDVRAADAGGLA